MARGTACMGLPLEVASRRNSLRVLRAESEGELRLVYGKDPWAEAEENDITLLVLDHEIAERVARFRRAKTWGDAFSDWPEGLEDLNRYRAEDGEPPRLPEALFDAASEYMDESGLLYRTHVESEDVAASLLGELLKEGLKPLVGIHVRFETGMIDCNRGYLRDDESAFLVWALFRESGLRRVIFSRDDALIAEVRAEW